MSERVYDPADFPHGLRCAECNARFVNGQRIATRPVERFPGLYMDMLICTICKAEPTSIGAKLRGEA